MISVAEIVYSTHAICEADAFFSDCTLIKYLQHCRKYLVENSIVDSPFDCQMQLQPGVRSVI